MMFGRAWWFKRARAFVSRRHGEVFAGRGIVLFYAIYVYVVVVLGQYGPRARLLLCRGASGSLCKGHSHKGCLDVTSLILVSCCPPHTV